MTLPSNAWAAPRATQRPPPTVTELLLTLSITHAKHHTTSKAPTHWSNPYSSLISAVTSTMAQGRVRRPESAAVQGAETRTARGISIQPLWGVLNPQVMSFTSYLCRFFY